MCIAQSLGLPEGLRPWVARVIPANPGERSARWTVYSTLAVEPECPSGVDITIDMRDGHVISTGPWNSFCDPAGSVMPER
jgi:hypothetical protein